MSTLYSTSINLGSSATFDAGTSANNIVQLDSNAKLPAVDGSQLTNLGITGSLVYRGVYNATTNNPVLTSASKGDFYKVSVQGTLAGVALNVNDHIVFNIDASSPITSAMFDVIDNTETSLATVANTGSYSDLINKPSLVSGLNDLSDCTTAGASNNQVLVHNGAVFTNAQLDYNQIANTPSLSTVATSGSYNDLSNKPTLGTASVLDVGTGANEIVQLNGSSQLPALDGSLLTSITSTDNTKLAIANDLSDLNSVATARTNLGLATVASTGSYNDLSNKPSLVSGLNDLSDCTTAGASTNQVLVHNGAVFANAQLNYNQIASTPTLGTASVLDVGTGANEIVQLNGSSQLPALDGSLLTSITSTDNTKLAIANDLSDLNSVATARTNLGLATVASTGSYNDLSNKPSLVSGLNDLSDCTTAGASNNQVLVHNGAVFANAQLNYNQIASTPTLGTASALDVGTGANEIVQLNGSSQLPALDGSLLTNLPSGGGLTYQARDTTAHSPLSGGTAPVANYHYSINANSANFVINLNALSSYSAGDQIRIKLQAQTGSNNITINPNGSDTIDGQNSASPTTLTVLYQAVTLVRGSTEWEVI